jgi:hypothetical protein
MADPPLVAGATKLTVACPFPATAATPVGGPGTVAGITGADGALGGLVPMIFVAVTVNV